MEFRFQSKAEPFSTLEASLNKLGSISEKSHSRAPSVSPKGLSEHFDYFDFGDRQSQPTRSPTYPFVPPGPSEAHILKSLGKASHVYHLHQERRTVPPIHKKRVHPKPSLTGPFRIRHSSTIDTTKSDSFEHTAIWDQKAILSLGMYSSQTLPNSQSNVIFALSFCNSFLGMYCLVRCDRVVVTRCSLERMLKAFQCFTCFSTLHLTWPPSLPSVLPCCDAR